VGVKKAAGLIKTSVIREHLQSPDNHRCLKKLYFCQKNTSMQLVIDIKHEKDLQVLLPLLERLKIAYKQLPSKANGSSAPPSISQLSDKYAGKLSDKVGEALQEHITESRREWERNT
jgi:hypothetical protein